MKYGSSGNMVEKIILINHNPGINITIPGRHHPNTQRFSLVGWVKLLKICIVKHAYASMSAY
jgi:hypothetical protein